MPTYSPYTGSSHPFAIGLKPLDADRWIEPDPDLPAYLEEKQRLAGVHYDDILREDPQSREAQEECLSMLVEHLTARHGNLYARSGDTMTVAGRTIDLADTTKPAIFRAGSLIQDDLLILQHKPDGWTMTAAHLAFPSSWSLAEKFFKSMDQIHAHVPGFQGGTRNAQLINRMFDKLNPDQPVERFNWSVNWRYALYHPLSVRPSSDPLSLQVAAANAFIRVERQTLRRLPETGALAFTVRIYIDPLRAIMSGPGGAERAAALAAQLRELTPEQVDYKGLKEQRDALIETLLAEPV